MRHILFRLCALFAALLILFPAAMPAASAYGAGTYATLKMRLATRTGPGTWYDEPGTFFSKDYRSQNILVLSKAWDNRNDIWWLQVEFTRGSQLYRAYTGLKRVNIDISDIPEEQVLGTAKTTRSAAAYWGPGTNYAASKYDIPSGRSVTVLSVENGYAQIEFYDSRTADRDYARRRAWIRTDRLTGSWEQQWQQEELPQEEILEIPTVRAGTYISTWESESTLTVRAVHDDQLTFDAFWYRITGLDNVIAFWDPSGYYSFNVSENDTFASGTLMIIGKTAYLTIIESNLPYIENTTYVYNRP